MSTAGADSSGDQSLSLDFDLPHPPEKVWRALTDPALLAEWLLPAIGLELKPGSTFTLTTRAFPGWDGTVNCQFIDIEPHRTLSYRWTVPFLDTVVTFSLTSIPIGTRLTVVQAGFKPEQKREFSGARYGWTMMGGKLAELLARIS